MVGVRLPLAPARADRVSGAHCLHFLVMAPRLSKQPGEVHCRTVWHRVMPAPHQLQKLSLVLICVLPSAPPHLQMALSVDAAGAGAIGVVATGGAGSAEEEENEAPGPGGGGTVSSMTWTGKGPCGRIGAALRRSAAARRFGGPLPCRMCHNLQWADCLCQDAYAAGYPQRGALGRGVGTPLPLRLCWRRLRRWRDMLQTVMTGVSPGGRNSSNVSMTRCSVAARTMATMACRRMCTGRLRGQTACCMEMASSACQCGVSHV